MKSYSSPPTPQSSAVLNSQWPWAEKQMKNHTYALPSKADCCPIGQLTHQRTMFVNIPNDICAENKLVARMFISEISETARDLFVES